MLLQCSNRCQRAAAALLPLLCCQHAAATSPDILEPRHLCEVLLLSSLGIVLKRLRVCSGGSVKG